VICRGREEDGLSTERIIGITVAEEDDSVLSGKSMIGNVESEKLVVRVIEEVSSGEGNSGSWFVIAVDDK
jgi:hypothetical protein